MRDSSEPYIICQDLFKIYKRAELEVVVLRGLDLEVSQGEFLGIIGSSGSGKTTLLNILAALDAPSAGQVYVGPRDLLDMAENDRVEYRRSEVGFVWQSPSRNLLPYLTAQENIELPMAIIGTPSSRRRDRARELLNALGLEEKAKHTPAQLSGGEQQRVAIGVGFANQPQLLLADEPTGELDSRTADDVFQSMRNVSRTFGVTIVAVTHYGGIARFADRVVQMRDGRIASEVVQSATYVGTDEVTVEEYLVIDRAGRLQLPQEAFDSLGLTGRAQVQQQGDSVVIRPHRRKE